MINVKRLMLPKVPPNIIDEVHNSIRDGINRAWEGDRAQYKLDQYSWIPGNSAVQSWCSENICPDIYFGIQVITANLPIHRDIETEVKFNYVIDSGGDLPETSFYTDEHELIESIVLQPHIWHILNVHKFHDVKNVTPGKTRISIVGRITP